MVHLFLVWSFDEWFVVVVAGSTPAGQEGDETEYDDAGYCQSHHHDCGRPSHLVEAAIVAAASSILRTLSFKAVYAM